MTNPERNTEMHPDPTPSTTTPGRTSTMSRSGRRRGTILGVGAGVLGGGLVGLAMTVPTFTNAASEDAGDTVVAALQDTDDTSTDDTRPDPGTRLREALQALVDDGTLTAEQADAVAEHLVAQMPERMDHDRGHGRHGPGGRPGFDGDVVADLIGIDAAELRSSLRDGQTIAELATANGVDVQVVIDALVVEAQSHLELAVENGRLTEEEAAEKLAEITERITARVNGETISGS